MVFAGQLHCAKAGCVHGHAVFSKQWQAPWQLCAQPQLCDEAS